MHVPDSITVGPNRSSVSRLHQDNDRLPVRMEVPNTIRLGKQNQQISLFIKYLFLLQVAISIQESLMELIFH
jgi:hypothetical protein